MILLDYSAVAIANMMIAIKRDGEQLTEQLCLHMIINSIRKYNKKFAGKFKPMTICCDAKTNWRKGIFPHYKYKRKLDKKNDDIDWDLIYKCLDYVKDELDQGFPYAVIEEANAEADDIIGVLARYADEIQEPTIIVSNDKDFHQLLSKNVHQIRPCTDSLVRNIDPELFLRELIIRGDASDGVPNIKSQDDIFTIEGKNQKRMYAKEIDIWIKDEYNTFLDDDEVLKENHKRNTKLIDLSYTPDVMRKNIIHTYNMTKQKTNKPKMTKFFMKHRLRYLHERINDFV